MDNGRALPLCAKLARRAGDTGNEPNQADFERFCFLAAAMATRASLFL
jgi:hypothetical protein